MGALQGDVASGGVRQGELRMLSRRLIGNRHGAEAFARGDETRSHELTEQGGSRGRGTTGCRRGIGGGNRPEDKVVTRSTVEGVLPAIADQNVVSGAAVQDIVATAADQNVGAVASVGGEQHGPAQPRRNDRVIAAKA